MPDWFDGPRRLARRLTASLRQADPMAGRTTRRRDPTARPVADGVQVEYRPQLDGDPDPGEVVWTWVPFEEDPTLGKDRPVVIIGRRGDELSAVALTSKRRHDEVDIGTGPWDRRGRTSYAKVDRLLDVDPGEVRREGAVLGRRRFDAVVEGVRRRHQLR